jgi:maleylacetoacetate isomerase/maleylpyruvate isomerase
MPTLYSYWRSSAAYRVRIALNIKGTAYDIAPIHLTRGGGEQFGAAYRAINPNVAVPTLVLDDGTALTQSMAIIEYLQETQPEPALLPADPIQRARVRAAAQLIACDIHPINNLRVVNHLKAELGHSADEVAAWMRHWMRPGLLAYAAIIESAGPFSFGGAATLADLCLVPQMYNARRWGLDMTGLDRLVSIDEACRELPAFANAAPENQPDAES